MQRTTTHLNAELKSHNKGQPIESYAKILEAIRSMNAGDEENALKVMLRISQELIVRRCLMCDNFSEGYYCDNCQLMFDDLAKELRNC